MQHSAGRQTPSNFAPEVALIRACGRALLEPADADHIRHLVGRGLDWDRLVWLARPHGMLPLLYRHLSAVCPGSVPSPVLHELQTRFDTNARRNFVVFAEVLEILRLFDKHGIRAIPYRGPVLAMQLFENSRFANRATSTCWSKNQRRSERARFSRRAATPSANRSRTDRKPGSSSTARSSGSSQAKARVNVTAL